MITQPAKVLHSFDDYCVVETIPKSACPRCAEGKGCGGGILAQAFANKTYQLEVPLSETLSDQVSSAPRAGTVVMVAMSSNGLLLASAVMYLLPLLVMIIFALATSIWISDADGYTLSSAVIGLGIGALLASKLSKLLIISTVTEPQLVELDDSTCWYPAD